MAQRIIAYDDTNERLVRTTKDPADVGTASSTGEAVNAGTQAISNGATSQAVTFVNAFSNTLYAVVAQLVNTTDALVQYQPLVITAKSTSGFTASWNSPTDSANYLVDFIAADPCITYRGGDLDVSSGVAFSSTTMFLANSFAIVGQFHNTVDAMPLFQPVVLVTQEAPTSIIPTIKHIWNDNTDSTNYDLEFLANSANCSTLKSFIIDIPNGASSLVVSFPFFDMESNSYAVAARFQNTVDAEAGVLRQPITITSKSATGFTAKWNTPVSSANYKLEWIANVVTT